MYTEDISANTIRSFMPSSFAGNIIIKDVTESTNTDAQKIAKSSSHGTTVIAKEQTSAHGRLGRKFFAPNGGVYMSIILKLDCVVSDAVLVTTAAAVAVCKAIESVSDEKPEIKWVNDILLNGKKVCGISCSTVVGIDGIDSVILGIGVNFSEQNFPEELKDTVCSLFTSEPKVSRNIFIAGILKNILSEVEEMKSRKYIDEYKKRSAVIGKEVRYLEAGVWHEAKAVDIDENGGLIVLESGKIRALVTGEITLRIRG